MKKKSKVLKRILVAAAIFLVLFMAAGFAVGNFFYELALNPNSDKSRVLDAEHNEVDYDEEATNAWRESLEWLDNAGYFTTAVESFDGLKLNGYVLEQPGGTGGNWVVINHGYNSAARVMAESAEQFYARGYNLLMPDARGCGRSEGEYIGMGWHDRLDILTWLGWLEEDYAPKNIVLYGVSMGGASVMMASGEALPQNVRAVIEDCGYTSAHDEFAYQAKQLFGLPAFPVLNFSSAVTRIRAGFWLGEADALQQVAKSTTPTLFIHGANDAFVPVDMVYQLYEAAACEKELLVVEDAGHGGAARQGGAVYWDAIDNFVGKYLA